MNSLHDEAGLYGAELAIFAERQKLPPEMFRSPDHIVIRAADIDDFGRVVREEIAPKSKLALCIEKEPRFKVAAELTGKLAVYEHGYVDWVEVDEPRIEHTETVLARAEFLTDSLEKALTILRARGVPSQITPEKNRAYIKVQSPPPRKLEFRLTDTPLSGVAESQLDAEEAVWISLLKQSA